MVKGIRAATTESSPSLPVSFDLRGATAYGGADVLADYLLNVLSLRSAFGRRLDPVDRDPAGYGFGVACSVLVLFRMLGLARPNHVRCVQDDPLLAAKFQLERLPEATTINRYIHRLGTQVRRMQLREVNWDLVRRRFKLDRDDEPKHSVVDLDSTVEVVYGEEIEGAEVGYNPRAHGRRSYHPLIISEGIRDLVLDVELRKGNAHTASGAIAKVATIASRLEKAGRPMKYLRADAGFRGDELFTWCEDHDVGYTIKSSKPKPLMRRVYALEFTDLDWYGDEEVQVAEMQYTAGTWDRTRRLVVVRKRGKDEGWLPNMGWSYEVIVTNLDWAVIDIWKFYNRRCQQENLIKELKAALGLDCISTASFEANEADQLLKVIAFNAAALFRHEVLPTAWDKFGLETLRRTFFTIAGVLRRHARALSLRLAAWYPHKDVYIAARERVLTLAAEVRAAVRGSAPPQTVAA
jgi:hypothetical protein